jgi:hypothetical protein
VSGSVDGLVPGVPRPLPLTVANPYNFAITVRTLTVGVSAASPACGANGLVVQQLPRPLTVARGASASVALDVRLSNDAANACQGATWPLAFTAQATQSGPSPSGTAAGGAAGGDASGGSSGTAGGNGGASNGGSGLAFTGANLWTELIAGVIALTAGLGLVLLGRRRGPGPTGGLGATS